MTEDYHVDNVNIDGPFDDLFSDGHQPRTFERLANYTEPTMNQLLHYSERRFADTARYDRQVYGNAKENKQNESEQDESESSDTISERPLAYANPLLDKILSLDDELASNIKKQESARNQLEQQAIKLQLYYKIYCYPAKTGNQVSESISVLDQQLINRHYLILQQRLYDLLLETANVFLPEFNTYIVDDRRSAERVKITSLVSDINDCIQTIYTTSVKQMQLTADLVHAQAAYFKLLSNQSNGQSNGQHVGLQSNGQAAKQDTDYDTSPDVDPREQLKTQHQIDNYLYNYMLNAINAVD